MAFNPDEYVAKNTAASAPASAAKAFDPSGYVQQKEVERTPNVGGKGFFSDFKRGVGLSAAKTYLGAKDLFTDLEPYEKTALNMWKDDVEAGGVGGTVGGVTGDVMQMAIPAGGLIKALKAIKFGRAALPASEVALAAGLGASRTADEGDTRLGTAATDGAMALAGRGLFSALGKGAAGIRRTPAADRLMDQGVYLTPGQATTNKTLEGFERAMSLIPFLARGTKNAQDRSMKSWGVNVMKQTAPDGTEITAVGKEGFKQLNQGVKTAYKEAWDAVDDVPEDAVYAIMGTIDDLAPKVSTDNARVLNGLTDDVVKLYSAGGPRAAQTLDNSLRKALQKAAPDNIELKEALKGIRQTYREGLPEQAAAGLAKIDAKYAGYLGVKKAVAKADRDGGVFTPKQLSDSTKSVAGETRTALGTKPLEDVTSDSLATVNRTDVAEGDIIGAVKRFMLMAPTPVPMKATGDVLLGRTAPQRLIQKANPLVNALRQNSPITAGGAATGYGNAEEY